MRKNYLIRQILFRKSILFFLSFFYLSQSSYSQCGSLELVTNSSAQCQPALFKWVVKNAPSGSSFTWNYGFGAQKGQDTLYAYINSSGKVNVSVQVKFPNNTVCTLSEPNFVEVYPKPIPKFYASRKVLCDGADTVTYFDITKNSSKRSWVIDGTNYYSAKTKQTHAFSSTGIKKLSLVVDDTNGCRAIKEFDSIAIIHKDVILDFTVDKKSGCVVKSVGFTPKINSNGLKILSYKWEFPGGYPNIQTKLNPDSVVFGMVGIFSPSLEVVAENGCVHKIKKDNFLSFGLIDSFTLKISDTSICRGKTITIENLNKKLPGTITWKLNGTTSVDNPDPFTCKAKYDTLGKYSVKVIYDYNGCTISKNLTNAIRVKGVKAKFSSLDYFHCDLPHIVHFKNESESFEPGKMIYQWRYSMNNVFLKSSTLQNDSIRVKQTGEIDVMLVTRHSNGCSDTLTSKKFIRNREIMPEFGSFFPVGCPNQAIEFTQNTPPSSYRSADQFIWTFYDRDDSTILGTSTSYAPTFKYKDTGLYTVKMIGYNGIGCRDSITKKQFIEIVNPKIKFDIVNPVICAEETIIGKANSQPNRAKFNYHWNLVCKTNNNAIYVGDSLFNRRFPDAGNYDFKFIHEINKGCRDSIVNNDLIKVNGISAQIQLDTFNGCSPLTVKPHALINYNFHHGSVDSNLRYKWTTDPSSNTIISDDTAKNPIIQFNLTGHYNINLELINSVGCSILTNSQTIFVGVRADMNVSDFKVCAGQDVELTDFSSLNPTKIKWLLPEGTYTSDDINSSKIKIHFKDDAEHTVGLMANKLDYCYDTVYRTIRSIIVKADFKAAETVMKCAPVYAQFESFSRHADSLRWSFGDGNSVTTTDKLVANIYQKNSGANQGFAISLIAESNEGCKDSLTKLNYVKVVGPVPSFELINSKGCEPLDVVFKNTSSDAFKHFLDHGDGTPLDSSFGKYTYSIIGANVNHQIYKPKMYAIDSMGCKADFSSPDSIKVLNNSISVFTVSDSVICENMDIALSDLSKEVIQSDFYYERTGDNTRIIASSNNTLSLAGDYIFTNVVKNSNQCIDSSKLKVLVNPNPIADFTIEDTVCYQKLLSAKDQTKGKFAISKYKWEVYNPDKVEFVDIPAIQYRLLNSGIAKVSLTVEDINQCSSSKLLAFTVHNPNEIPVINLKSVSVNFDNTIQINSSPVSYNRFLFGSFYKSDSILPIRKTIYKGEENFSFPYSNANISSVCFDYKLTDVCGYEGEKGIKHCTILLNVVDDKPFTNRLNWSPYIGWSKVDKYEVYRKKQGENKFTPMATLNGDVTTYLDSGLCNLEYQYYVKAKYDQLESQSNLDLNVPKFEFPPQFKDVKNVSVIDQNTIEVRWLANNNINFNNYELYKTNVQTYQSEVIYTTTNRYIDKDVNTALYNYVYQVSETDKCGYQSKTQYQGKNIVLNTVTENYSSFANWDTYKSWQSGVSEYQLQIEKENQFQTIFTTTNADSVFVHDQALENIHGPYCYRIMAVSGDLKDTSFSNVSCVVSPSTLFFPNAFSPNGDGTNDKIGVKSLFVYDNTHLSGRNFTLEIFNRWGERVYLSHDIDAEWDGIYQGKLVQTGVYSFRIKAMGVDNRSYSMKGGITIVP